MHLLRGRGKAREKLGTRRRVYHYPKDQACKIALDTTIAFLREFEEIERVRFVCFSEADYALYRERFAQID